MTTIRYAKGPVVYLYDKDKLKTKKKQLLWGDWLRIGDDINDDWSEVKWGRSTYAIKKDDYQEERLLEIIFLDVGQGDGCILTTPQTGDDERVMIVDAGVGSNMWGFLRYRFRDFREELLLHAAIITHPDSDHYRGFQKIFDQEQLSFEHVYHNGLLERTGSDLLGPEEDGFLTDIRPSKMTAHDLYQDKAVRGRKQYPKLIWTALTSDRFRDVAMLSTEHGHKENGRTWMPGFAPSNNPEFTIEVLGPVVEKAPSGRMGLRTFPAKITHTTMDEGKTKNGHSVLMRLRYRDFSILFGGDLNTPAEIFLTRHYGNDGKAPTTIEEMEAMIKKARQRFGVDLMKCCHHGSSDVTDEFLEATKPAAFIVSSGDKEDYVHPRPDLLGLLGKKGRGKRPLILCTEILRSTREKEDQEDRARLAKLLADIDEVTAEIHAGKNVEENQKEKEEYEEKRDDIIDKLFKRNVGVYGAVNLRTDGRTAVVAFRLEDPTSTNRWFYYELKKDEEGIFQVVEKTEGH